MISLLKVYKHDTRMLQGISSRLDAFLELSPARTLLSFGAGDFIEEEGCTYYAQSKQGRHGKKKMILNALLRVEFKINVEGNDSYHGHLIFAGLKVSISFPATALLSPAKWRHYGQARLRAAVRKACGKHLVGNDTKCHRLAEGLVAEMERSND